MKPARITAALAAALYVAVGAAAAQTRTLSAAEARDHVGEKATVCGSVASARYAAQSRGRPTFLNLDKPYPRQLFTVVIWGEHRDKFSPPPEEQYRSKSICVSGKIDSYQGTPQIVVHSPYQIRVREER